jgi:hypothetical protein
MAAAPGVEDVDAHTDVVSVDGGAEPGQSAELVRERIGCRLTPGAVNPFGAEQLPRRRLLGDLVGRHLYRFTRSHDLRLCPLQMLGERRPLGRTDGLLQRVELAVVLGGGHELLSVVVDELGCHLERALIVDALLNPREGSQPPCG